MSSGRRHKRKQRLTKPAAYTSALEVCELAGPAAIAEQYAPAMRGKKDKAIARAFAELTAHGPARRAAYRGARDGFSRYRSKQR